MCLAQSGQMPSSAHSSSAGSGCCHRSRGHSVHYNAVHDIHHTPGHQEHTVSPQPAQWRGGGGGSGGGIYRRPCNMDKDLKLYKHA